MVTILISAAFRGVALIKGRRLSEAPHPPKLFYIFGPSDLILLRGKTGFKIATLNHTPQFCFQINHSATVLTQIGCSHIVSYGKKVHIAE